MSEFWAWLTDNFNNRELAGAVWLAAILIIFAVRKDIRRGLANVVGAALNHKLLILFSSFAANVAILSWLGTFPKLWSLGLITPTIVWYFLGGLPLLARAFDAKEGTQHFRGYAKDAVSGTALLEFIFVAKTFSLPVELILTPLITVIAMMVVVSERNPAHAAVNKLLTWVISIIAVVILWNSIAQIWAEPGDFFTTNTFRSFILPVYLTIGSIPFFYAMHCYSHIEGARIQIDQKTFQSDELKRYAKKRFILTFMARPWLLRRATRQFHIMPARASQDVDKIIHDILDYEREAQNPPGVDQNEGWSPHSAREFLADEGLRTGDYHAGYDGEEWWSGVASKELDNSLLPSHVNYSFAGVKGLVKRLKLKGHFIEEFTTDDALAEFSRLAVRLVEKTVANDTDEIADRLRNREEFAASIGANRIQFKNERFPNERGYELILEIER
ncbi:hypothetical protein [Nitratireductor sp. OM-1]|uniref:hypothetical protein n=1 Tax=Nitratireductor sp. OM-1 TaxID=1756988 RepID=UPI000DDD44B0|nr:hypothetical protein [Nitratireductor sp. OM-1]